MTKPVNLNQIYRKENIQDMLSWSLDKKINHALKRIREFYDSQNGKVFVSFSGGKDSTVLLHLVRSLYPYVVAVFSNTTNEYSEILEFVRTIDNLITVHPLLTFNQTVEKFGFPLVSKKVSRAITDLRENRPETANVRNLYLTGFNRKGVYCPTYKLAKKWYPLFQEADFNITNKCCDILKKEPMNRFKRESGLKPFVGTTVSEGGYRKDSWLKEGCNIIKGSSSDTSRPLSIFTESDMWEYIKRFNLSYSSIYDDVLDEDGNIIVKGEVHTGCSYCAFGANQEKSDLVNKNRFERLALRKPKQYKKMMQLKNNGVTFDEALSFIKVNH
jgi:3'-phosphoadenosine 5'-phosphosulfate sulfotransferase (PAPS reductase)/FAD synthetase